MILGINYYFYIQSVCTDRPLMQPILKLEKCMYIRYMNWSITLYSIADMALLKSYIDDCEAYCTVPNKL
jgi:hypothetical protein